MVTKLLGVKEFRQNISAYYKKSLKNNWQYIILNRNEPIFEVRPIKKTPLWKNYTRISRKRVKIIKKDGIPPLKKFAEKPAYNLLTSA